MKRFTLSLLFFLFCISNAFCINISGTVRSATDGQPLEAATVFLSGTSCGTHTDKNGTFCLKTNIKGYNEVVVSYMGYLTATQILRTDTGSLSLKVVLQPKSIELGRVNIVGKDPHWKENLETFKFALIGNSRNARQCRILNPEVIHLQRKRLPGLVVEYTLVASADSAIIIENEALGYTIRYELDYLRQNRSEASYKGNAFFIDNLSRIKNKERILARRRKAYEGSRMHFFRSLSQNKLEEQGFEVSKVEIVSNDRLNVSKLSVNPMGLVRMDYGLLQDTLFCPDRGKHLRQTVQPFDLWSRIIPNFSDGSFSLYCNQSFEIRYIMNGEDSEYNKSKIYHDGISRRSDQQTTIVRLTSNVIRFYPNGSMSDPTSLLIMGYWSFNKLADFLPWEYQPD